MEERNAGQVAWMRRAELGASPGKFLRGAVAGAVGVAGVAAAAVAK